MSTKLGTVLADFTTNLATALAVAGTSVTLQSATDDDGVALPSGRYFFTLDGSNSNKEHISCDLVGTALTNIKTVTRQGVESAGVARAHRIGCTVSLTDFAHLLYINNLLAGTTNLNSLVPLGYDGTASITTANQLATKAYVDSVAIAGAPNASTTVKGIVEMATQAEVLSKTATGGTGAVLAVSADTMPSTLLSDYKVDTGAANAYVITPSPAITAYTTGQIFSFKAVNANTTASTLNVNGLGVKTIKKLSGGFDLVANDIIAGAVVVVEYDGTNFQLISPVSFPPATQNGASIYAADAGGSDTYVITLVPALAAYTTGMVVHFKANTINTGAASLNVNGLGAKTIKKSLDQDLNNGDIKANQLVSLIYDGTNFQMLSPTATTPLNIYANGQTSKNAADASTTQNIAHGLGVIPKFITLKAGINTSVAGTPTYVVAESVYNGTTQSSLSFYTSATNTVIADTSFTLNAANAGASQTGVVTFDATNIIITWTKSGSPTGTYNITWTAQV